MVPVLRAASKNKIDTIEAFDNDIGLYWQNMVEPKLEGRLWADAERAARKMMTDFLQGRLGKIWRQAFIICNDRNNPPADRAQGKFTLTIMGPFFGVEYRRSFTAGPKPLGIGI